MINIMIVKVCPFLDRTRLSKEAKIRPARIYENVMERPHKNNDLLTT